jgi:small subunit ribosomal protein S6
MLMLDVDLTEERQNEILTRARELVEKDGGTWVGQESWGRRKLAYEIDKKTDAIYYLLHFDCEPATLDELTRILKITDGAMRHMAVRRLPSATRTATTSSAAPSESEAAPEPERAAEPAAAPAEEAAPEPVAVAETEAETEAEPAPEPAEATE